MRNMHGRKSINTKKIEKKWKKSHGRGVIE